MAQQGEFEKLVRKAIVTLPANIQKEIDNLAIVIEKWPNPDNLKKGGVRLRGNLLGLYQGVPKTTWGRGFGQRLPDKITIFQGPIIRLAKSPQDIEELVKIVVWHEIAHHFGLDEAKIRRLEAKWRKKMEK